MAAYVVTDGTKTEWEVHREGCSHARRKNPIAVRGRYKANTPEKVARHWIDPDMEAQGWTSNDIRVMTCAKTKGDT